MPLQTHAMKKQKNKYVKCPCCGIERHKTEMKLCLSLFEKAERFELKHYKELKIDTYDNFIECDFEWACDACLNEKKAIPANPKQQVYAWNPNLAYADKNLTCRTCCGNFMFTKEEKLLWYEKLKFWIDSEPVNCLKCRRQLRLLKSENKTLSEILKKDKSQLATEELKTVADIYRKWDKVDKVKYYEALLKKKLKANIQ